MICSWTRKQSDGRLPEDNTSSLRYMSFKQKYFYVMDTCTTILISLHLSDCVLLPIDTSRILKLKVCLSPSRIAPKNANVDTEYEIVHDFDVLIRGWRLNSSFFSPMREFSRGSITAYRLRASSLERQTHKKENTRKYTRSIASSMKLCCKY